MNLIAEIAAYIVDTSGGSMILMISILLIGAIANLLPLTFMKSAPPMWYRFLYYSFGKTPAARTLLIRE